MSGAALKQFRYRHDKAGNRTSEQIDLGVNGANYIKVNPLRHQTAMALKWLADGLEMKIRTHVTDRFCVNTQD